MRLTPEFLELKRLESFTTNTKYYFGPNIPTLFLREGPDDGKAVVKEAVAADASLKNDSKSQ